MSVYDVITDRIVKRLEEAEKNGEVFYWVKPFSAGAVSFPCCFETGEPYRGINRLLLEPDEYTTFAKVQAHNKKHPENTLFIRKGARANIAVYFNYQEVKDENGNPKLDKKGKPLKKPYMRYYTVFSRQDILDKDRNNLASKFPVQKYSHDEMSDLTRSELMRFGSMVNAYCRKNGIELQFITDGTECYYSPSENTIRVPLLSNFDSTYEYISAVSHELCHSTGLNQGRFGTSPQSHEKYSAEELVAEVGASMLISNFKIEDDRIHKENDIAYLQSWAKELKGNSKEILFAAQKAQKAVEAITEFLDKEETLDEKLATLSMFDDNSSKEMNNTIDEER
ncbi:MAG: zincin-like metallopeptidase domain-containing protein [Acutalibacteraceae bacterium]